MRFTALQVIKRLDDLMSSCVKKKVPVTDIVDDGGTWSYQQHHSLKTTETLAVAMEFINLTEFQSWLDEEAFALSWEEFRTNIIQPG